MIKKILKQNNKNKNYKTTKTIKILFLIKNLDKMKII